MAQQKETKLGEINLLILQEINRKSNGNDWWSKMGKTFFDVAGDDNIDVTDLEIYVADYGDIYTSIINKLKETNDPLKEELEETPMKKGQFRGILKRVLAQIRAKQQSCDEYADDDEEDEPLNDNKKKKKKKNKKKRKKKEKETPKEKETRKEKEDKTIINEKKEALKKKRGTNKKWYNKWKQMKYVLYIYCDFAHGIQNIYIIIYHIYIINI